MNRQILIDNAIRKISQMPDLKIREINDYADFLLSKIDDQIIREGISQMCSDSKAFDFLNKEEDLYTIEDLKERCK